jgi:hypothetical protein
VAQVEPVALGRQHGKEGLKVGGIEFFGRSELPQDRPQPVAQLTDAGLEKKFKRFAGLRQHTLLHDIARALDREHEPVAHFLAPFGEGCRRLRAVERAIDFDGRQLGARVGEFLGVRQTLGIELAAPGLKGPAADPDPDVACLRHGLALNAGRAPRLMLCKSRCWRKGGCCRYIRAVPLLIEVTPAAIEVHAVEHHQGPLSVPRHRL